MDFIRYTSPKHIQVQFLAQKMPKKESKTCKMKLDEVIKSANRHFNSANWQLRSADWCRLKVGVQYVLFRSVPIKFDFLGIKLETNSCVLTSRLCLGVYKGIKWNGME